MHARSSAEFAYGRPSFETAANGWLNVTTWTLLRVGAGLLFMQHGAQKLFGWFGGMDGAGATAPLVSLMGLAGVLELFGGALIVIGLATHLVAVILVVEMIAAYVITHAPQGGAPVENAGELALLYLLIFLYLATHGAGPWSVDGAAARRALARDRRLG